MKYIAIIIAALLIPACQTDTGNPTKDRNARVTNATLAIVGRAVENFAFNSFMNMAEDGINGKKIDFGSSASVGLATTAKTLVNEKDVQSVIDAWSGNQLPAIAKQAATQFAVANPQTPADRVAVANTISVALSNATSKALASLP